MLFLLGKATHEIIKKVYDIDFFARGTHVSERGWANAEQAF